MLGLVALPALFVWFLLRPGYPRSTRTVAFVYAFGPALLMIAVTMCGGVFRMRP